MIRFKARLRQIFESAAYNLASTAITIFSIGMILLPAVWDLQLTTLRQLDLFDWWILAFFVAESFVRYIVNGKSYLFSPAFWIDILSIAPPVVAIAILYAGNSEASDIPGLLLLKGGRILRIVPQIRYFQDQRTVGLKPQPSTIQNRLFTGCSLIVFVFFLVGGTAIARLHANITNSEKTARVERVTRYLKFASLPEIAAVFPEWILKASKQSLDENFDIYYEEPERIKLYYRYGRDYVFLPGSEAGESILISFRDLYKRQLYLELMILLTGLLMLFSLLLGIFFYYRGLVRDPVDRAIRVMTLRLQGEEILNTEIETNPPTEITELVNGIDQMYQKLRAPARKLIADRQTEF